LARWPARRRPAWWGYWTGRAQRREALAETRQAELVAALTELVTALANHRRAMLIREECRLTSTDADTWAAERAASHETRAAVTAPLVRFSVLAPDLAGVAKEAEQATYALRAAADPEVLQTRRTLAVEASDRLVREAGQVLAQHRRTAA
jgi:hypothetical protein